MEKTKKIKEYQKRYYEKNKEKILDYSRRYYYKKKYDMDIPPDKTEKEKPFGMKITYGDFVVKFE